MCSRTVVVEVLSQSTALKNRNYKLHMYERTGVVENQLFDALDETVEMYGLLVGYHRKRKVFGRDDSLLSFYSGVVS